MDTKRQKNQLELAFGDAGRGEAPKACSEGTEMSAASRSDESPAGREYLMEEVVSSENVKKALQRVRMNRGGPGIDGMTVEALPDHLRDHWPGIREQLLSGEYRPQPVKRVEIPKPSGGVRKLGVPTVVDRLIQQAILQVLQPRWDPTFSEHSYGFRPGRSAHQAVAQAQQYIAEGYDWVVDFDLEKFFDRVNHDQLMAGVAQRVGDKRLLKLLRAYLSAGVMENGLVGPTTEGTPQGGPLSPLLSNLVLDALDRELEQRGIVSCATRMTAMSTSRANERAPGLAVGDEVDVTGLASEFFNFSELSGFPVVTMTGTATVPAAVDFNATVPSPDPLSPSCAIEFECYEGMLVEVADGTVTGPNQRFGPDPIAEVHITAASTRTFREPGVEFPGLGMPPIPTWDGNPEVFELDPDKLGLPNQIIPAGSSFSAAGVLGFEFGGYELWPTSLTVVPAPLPVAVRERDPGEFTVGTLNLFRLFDDVDDPPDGDREDFVVSTAEYLRRLHKFASYIVEVMDSPGILAVQEAEKLGVLEDLAAAVNVVDPSVHYTAYLIEGNDIGTIDVGFLVRDNINVDAVTQLGKAETFIDPTDGSVDILHDRPPLLLEGSCQLEFGTYPISVMVVHNRSLSGIDGSGGERVRVKRLLQAEFIAIKVQELQVADPDVRLVVTGDFNAFEFTDGYVDSLGVITGEFDPTQSFVCSETVCLGDLVEPNLDNQVLGMDAGERYSFIFRGSAQVLDHALTSSGIAAEVSGAEFGRGNADAAVDLINDDGTVDPSNLPLRSSDHDGLVVYVLKDEDADGVPNDLDVCPGTVIPEGVPTVELGTNRWALVDGDGQFDTNPPNGQGPGLAFSLGDTGGCSCEQIIDAQGLGKGQTKFGCSNSAMTTWVDLVNP